MYTWTKYFLNRPAIKEPNSWSQTPLDQMTEVELKSPYYKISIQGMTDFWQSDDYITNIFSIIPQLIKRRIEAYINKPYIIIEQNTEQMKFIFTNHPEKYNNVKVIDLSSHFGKWFSVSVDKENKLEIQITENKI